MVSFCRGIANQTLKNKPICTVKIRCRLEKTGKTGKVKQAGDKNPVTLIFSRRYLLALLPVVLFLRV